VPALASHWPSTFRFTDLLGKLGDSTEFEHYHEKLLNIVAAQVVEMLDIAVTDSYYVADTLPMTIPISSRIRGMIHIEALAEALLSAEILLLHNSLGSKSSAAGFSRSRHIHVSVNRGHFRCTAPSRNQITTSVLTIAESRLMLTISRRRNGPNLYHFAQFGLKSQ
jgi:hypothetical protein